ncbi:MAG: MFS transporter [Candidatus Planktophila sp.]|nr:MFS transporter [Candidatus Planktophila sp.]
MKRYRELFTIPNVWVLVLAAFPARVAYGMVALAIFFKTEQTTGSVAVAGLAIGINSVAGAATAGMRGSLMDRFGQKWPLRIFVPGYVAMLLVLNTMDNKNAILLAAFFLGITAPPINLSVRPLWRMIVPEEYLRTAYAVDTSVMSTAGVIGPVVATSLALSSHPGSALSVAAALMAIGGGALALTQVSRDWKPEKKDENHISIWKNKAIQLLMIEGCFIGFGWGVFDVAVPAFATLEDVPHRTAWILTAMGLGNIIGGLLGGLVSGKVSALKAMRLTYLTWVFISIPIIFTYPGWSMVIAGAFLGLVGGTIQVFYWEVMEAVRPKGSAVGMMGWIWTVEGTLMSIGAAAGGWIAETFSPRFALSITTFTIISGFMILNLGRKRLAAADRIPTVEEDLAAMSNNSPSTK